MAAIPFNGGPCGGQWSKGTLQNQSKPDISQADFFFFFNLKKFGRHVLPIGDNVTRISLFPFCHVELGRGTEQEECGDSCVSQAPEKKSHENAWLRFGIGDGVSTAGGAKKSGCLGP